MNPIDYVIIAVVAVILGLVIWYIWRAKKKGAKCIGCPAGGNCSGQCSGCSCGCGKAEKK
jgi:hypothetical protein